eukprot:5432110-Pleurochrysis_carterae.AAC.2
MATPSAENTRHFGAYLMTCATWKQCIFLLMSPIGLTMFDVERFWQLLSPTAFSLAAALFACPVFILPFLSTVTCNTGVFSRMLPLLTGEYFDFDTTTRIIFSLSPAKGSVVVCEVSAGPWLGVVVALFRALWPRVSRCGPTPCVGPAALFGGKREEAP